VWSDTVSDQRLQVAAKQNHRKHNIDQSVFSIAVVLSKCEQVVLCFTNIGVSMPAYLPAPLRIGVCA
jgi:hypothetical protein